MSSINNNQRKEYEEMTLYNFVTIRNADYFNKDNLSNDPDYIFYHPEEFYIQKSECDFEEVLIDEDKNYNAKEFLDFEKLKKKYKVDFCNLIQVKLNNSFNEINYLYQNKIDDYRKIYQLLNNFDALLKETVDKKFGTSLNEKEKEQKLIIEEKIFIKKIWYSFIVSVKVTNNLKQKEIGTNLLKYFHLRKHVTLFDFESKDEKKINFDRLINAKIIIPKELFPKSETFYYNTQDNDTADKHSNTFIKNHLLKILLIREDIIDKITNEDSKAVFENEILESKKSIEREYKDEKANDLSLINKLSYIPYIVTVEKLDEDFYFMLDFDKKYLERQNIKIDEIKIFKDGKKDNEAPNLIIPLDENEISNESKFDCFYKLNSDYLIPHKNDKQITLEFGLEFSNGTVLKINLALDLVKIDDEKKDIITFRVFDSIVIDEYDQFGTAYPPSGHGVQMLGIADYRKVVSTISRYVPAEVAHIENVMASEFREKVTTKEISTEITDFYSTETETEKTKETSTTDRLQMQSEVASIINEQRNNNFEMRAGYSGGGYSLNLTTGNSTQNSKQNSNKQAIENAKEITNKAVEKIVQRVKTERTVKSTEKFIDVNKYGFDNRQQAKHVSGIYRHINAVYKNQIHNYGKRLTYEFSVPEPALIYLLNKNDEKLLKEINKIPKPIDLYEKIKTFDDLNCDNYLLYIKNYEIEDDKYEKCPVGEIIHRDLKKRNISDNNVFEKNNLKISGIKITGNFNLLLWAGEKDYDAWVHEDLGIRYPEFNIYNDLEVLYKHPKRRLYERNEDTIYINDSEIQLIETDLKFDVLKDRLVLKVQETCLEYNLNISVMFIPDACFLSNWKIKTFELLKTTYENLLSIYQKEVKKAIEMYLGEEKAKLSNTDKSKQVATKRQIEINTLKRNCQSYLINDEKAGDNRKFGADMYEIGKRKFNEIKIKKTKDLDEYTAFIRFLEQAFEWDNMSYSFYPYYWGEKNTWEEHYLQNDDDPLHKSFLQAGMARVIVTVRPGFEEAVNLYMVTGKIWNGGSIPVYGSSLFVSIDKELKDNADYKVEGEWESVLPTSLIALQSDGVAIHQSGLPDLDKKGNLGNLIPNTDKLPTINDCENKKKKFLGLF